MKTIFIGPAGGGKIPTNGVSVKNYHSLSYLIKIISPLYIIDTENWKKNPIILFNLLYKIFLFRNSKFIISANGQSADKVIKLIKYFNKGAKIIYWIVGGNFAKRLNENVYNPNLYKKLDKILVEGKSIKEELDKKGFSNVQVMLNFKKIIKVNNSIKRDRKLNFVFLSRILPEKGCDILIEAVQSLNKKGYENKYSIDFYGPIESSYKDEFLMKINKTENLHYKGFLDLRNEKNYEILSSYDAMLFPTYWPGEGCPGVVIDAYIAGIPILASDWNLNKDYIINNQTGVLFKPKDLESVEKVLFDAIEGRYNLKEMGGKALIKASDFDITSVLSRKNLYMSGMI